MAIDEFDFIHKYFANLNSAFDGQARKNGLDVGIGDDAALIKFDGTYAVTTDSLIEGVHFFSGFNPFLLGSRALEVNFSDFTFLVASIHSYSDLVRLRLTSQMCMPWDHSLSSLL